MTPAGMGRATTESHGIGGDREGDSVTLVGLEGKELSQRKIFSCFKI